VIHEYDCKKCGHHMNTGTIPSKCCGQCGEYFDGRKRQVKYEEMEPAFQEGFSGTFYLKKYTEKATFKPHYNSEMGKFYDTKREYLSDMKAKGLEPYRGGDVHKREAKVYAPSKECREITKTLERNGLTGSVKSQLAKMGIKEIPRELVGATKGGWN
jgi:hypothetical protein